MILSVLAVTGSRAPGNWEIASDLGPFLVTVIATFVLLLAFLVTVGLITFPWFIRRIMLDVAVMKKLMREGEARAVSLRAIEAELQRQQIAQLQALNAKLDAAEVVKQ